MAFYLDTPFLTPGQSRLLRNAWARGVPIALVGNSGAGVDRVARSLHGASTGTFLWLGRSVSTADELRARLLAVLEQGPCTLYVDELPGRTRNLHEELVRILESNPGTHDASSRVRVIAQLVSEDDWGSLPSRLRWSLRAASVPLKSLDERREELAELLVELLREVATGRAMPVPAVNRELLRGLTERYWPGGFEELEQELLRFALSGELPEFEAAETLATEALERSAEAPATSVPAPEAAEMAPEVAPETARPQAELKLEFVLQELSHQLKNPMVTIKTFGEHIDEVVADEVLRAKFVELNRDAILRMDGVLEDLLVFSRFGAPRDAEHALAGCFRAAMLEADLPSGQLDLGGVPESIRVRADEEQLVFALKMLLRDLRGRLPRGAGMVAMWQGGGEVVLTSPARAADSPLGSLIGGEENENATLDLVLAQSLLSRMKIGCERIRSGSGSAALLVRLAGRVTNPSDGAPGRISSAQGRN